MYKDKKTTANCLVCSRFFVFILLVYRTSQDIFRCNPLSRVA